MASDSAAHPLLSSCTGLALSSWHCSSLFARNLSHSFNPGWPYSAAFLLCWQALNPQSKHLYHAALCIFSCCSFYMEFTPLSVSFITKELHTFVLQAAQN